MNKERKWDLLRVLELCGIAALVCYVLHDILGAMNYPGYSAMKQAVSDLTADGAPSVFIARPFSCAYGILALVGTLAVVIEKKSGFNKVQHLGCITLLSMHCISFFGYTLFPLSETSQFSNIMHIVVTVLVVLSSIVTMVLFIIGSAKKDGMKILGIGALIALLAMMAGAIGSGLVSPSIFGLVERFSTYSAVVFTAFLGCFAALRK